jgi:hypothetical protein
MPSLVLGPMLRHVTGTTATIWMETDEDCSVEVLGRSTQTFTVEGHHYALVVLRDLEPGSTTPYDVRLNGEVCWPPPASPFPVSTIRTFATGRPVRLLFGSCRAAAPHEPPYSLEPADDPLGRGVDALRAHGLRMLATPPDQWPDLLVLVGDQIYADDSSPRTEQRIELTRDRGDLPANVVANFEEYTWLYHESWRPDVERWLFSVLPSTMVFDDHDMLDDWNISGAWVRDIRAEPWWQEHIVGGLVSYWIYQHLGNLSPDELDEEGMLAQAVAARDAGPFLREWAFGSEQFTPIPGGYRFSCYRELGAVRLVVIEARNGRTLDPHARAMVDDGEWEWIVGHCRRPVDHLVLATSLPVFVPGGLHGLQQWNEAVCDGKWGRPLGWLGERMRRALDLEDWAAFDRSFRAFVDLLDDLSRPRHDYEPPATITVVSGDIHFSYVAGIERVEPAVPGASRMTQVVSSPIRNSLGRRERRVLRFGVSRIGRRIGGLLQRAVGLGPCSVQWEIEDGPIFSNSMGELVFEGDEVRLRLERSRPDDQGNPILDVVVDRKL